MIIIAPRPISFKHILILFSLPPRPLSPHSPLPSRLQRLSTLHSPVPENVSASIRFPADGTLAGDAVVGLFEADAAEDVAAAEGVGSLGHDIFSVQLVRSRGRCATALRG